jgi:hypothetical protein
MNVAIALVVPFSYIWAFNGWMLLPAFIGHGIVAAGMDLGVISAGIKIAGVDEWTIAHWGGWGCGCRRWPWAPSNWD